LILLASSIVLVQPPVFRLLKRVPLWQNIRVLQKAVGKVDSALLLLHEAGPRKWRIYLLSFAVQIAGVIFYYALGRALGIPLSGWQYLVIVPLTVLATMIPLTPNGLGTREAALVLLTASLTGLDLSASAIALGLLAATVILFISLAGVGFYVVGQKPIRNTD
jgi:uncharacterized membrane protein YbhN (UPF0104 family)